MNGNAAGLEVFVNGRFVRQHNGLVRSVHDAHHIHVVKLGTAFAPVGVRHDVMPAHFLPRLNLAPRRHGPVKQRVEAGDALAVLQRAELATRMAVEVERYIVELGTEGRLIEMQLEETMVGVAVDKAALIRDYSAEDSEQNLETVMQSLARMPHQDVLDFGRLAELLGYDRKVNTLDFPVAPRGYRVLGRIPRIPKLVVQKIIHEFGGFEEVLAASDADLEAVDGVGSTRAKDIREGLRRLREVDLVDRYLQS